MVMDTAPYALVAEKGEEVVCQLPVSWQLGCTCFVEIGSKKPERQTLGCVHEREYSSSLLLLFLLQL